MKLAGALLGAAALVALGSGQGGPAGTLDRSFGQAGRLEVRFAERVAVRDVLVLPGGSIVVAGNTTPGTGLNGGRLVWVKRRRDGSPDRSVGNRGRVVTALPGGPAKVGVIVRLPDRGFLVAGSIGVSEVDQDVLVARLTSGGQLDPSFGTGGVRRIDLGGATEEAGALTLRPDGAGILVAGSTATPRGPGRGEAFVTSLRPDGQTDTGFGSGGTVRVRSDAPTVSMGAVGVTVDRSGRVVMAGNSTDSARQSSHVVVARFAPDGAPDPGLGPLGFRMLPRVDHLARAMAVDPRDGRLVLAGGAGFAVRGRFVVTRLTHDLQPDPGFGDEGYAAFSFRRTRIDMPHSVAVDSRGRSVVAGTALRANGQGSFALARLTASGRRDRSFGRDGRVTTRFGGRWKLARAVALEGGRRIVAVGSELRRSLDSGGRSVYLAAYRAAP